MKSLGETRTTHRGFEAITFRDRSGDVCSLQQSSAADYVKPGTSAVWLGNEESRMHLSRGHVKALISHLQSWLDSDTFSVSQGASDDAPPQGPK